MKNYEEKEKKLDKVINKLNTMSNEAAKMNNDINILSAEKNQLLSEKADSEKKFKALTEQHEQLKSELEKVNRDLISKFGGKK